MGAEGVIEGGACLDQSDLDTLRGFDRLNGENVMYGGQNFLLTVWQGEEQAYLALKKVGSPGSNPDMSFQCDMSSGQLHAVIGWNVSSIRAFLNGVQFQAKEEVA